MQPCTHGFFRSRICTERPNYSTLTPESRREKSVERVSARRSSLKWGERATVNQTNINRNCFKGTAGENGFWETDWAHMGLAQRIDAILNWRELNWTLTREEDRTAVIDYVDSSILGDSSFKRSSSKIDQHVRWFHYWKGRRHTFYAGLIVICRFAYVFPPFLESLLSSRALFLELLGKYRQ